MLEIGFRRTVQAGAPISMLGGGCDETSSIFLLNLESGGRGLNVHALPAGLVRVKHVPYLEVNSVRVRADSLSSTLRG